MHNRFGEQPALTSTPVPGVPNLDRGPVIAEQTLPSDDALLAAFLASAVRAQAARTHTSGRSDVTNAIEGLLTLDPRTMGHDSRAAILYFANQLTDRYTPEGMQDGQ